MGTPSTTMFTEAECVVKLDDNGTTPTLYDMSGEHSKTSIKFGMKSEDFYVHASSAPIRGQAKQGIEFDFEIGMSTATDEAARLVLDWYHSSTLFGTAKTIEVYIPNTSTGSYKWAGEVKLTKPPEFPTDASSAKKMVMKFSVGEDGAGAITFTTV